MKKQFAPYEDSLTIFNKLSRLVWNVVYYLAFKPFAGPVFKSWRVNVLRLFGAKIGSHCAISGSCIIWAPWNLEAGDYVAIAAGAEIYDVDKIHIGSNVTISQGAYICTASHDISRIKKPLITRPVTIHDSAWVCAKAMVMMGVTVSEGGVVGAGAVVTKDVEPWTVVGGNPAKFIKKRVLV